MFKVKTGYSLSASQSFNMSQQIIDREIRIQAEGTELRGEAILPVRAIGFVIFAHAGGNSWNNPRNHFIAKILRNAGLGTVMVNFLTEAEDEAFRKRFDIRLLTRRLLIVTDWLLKQESYSSLPFGYLGSGTGTAAALLAASVLGGRIRSIVSRGGRPDLALDVLPKVMASTLLIVGGLEYVVLDLNQLALERLGGEKHLEIISETTHLFEEFEKLEETGRFAVDWFSRSFLDGEKNGK